MDLIVLFVTHRAARLVLVVEDKSHAGLGHASLAMFVDQLLEVVGTHLEKKRGSLSEPESEPNRGSGSLEPYSRAPTTHALETLYATLGHLSQVVDP